MAKGFSGMPANMLGLLKQAQKMQEDLAKAQEEAAKLTAEGSSGGGMVKATANGSSELVSLAIEAEVVNPEEIEMLQDLVQAACNEALRKANEQVKEKLGKLTSGLNIPGLV